LTIKCLWQEELYFLERKFLVGENHGKEIELDETQLTNETTQDYEMKTEIIFFNVLKLPQRSSPLIIAVQEPAIVQEQVNEPILEPIQQPMNPMHEPSRKSTRVHHAPDRLNLMVLDDTSNEVYHDDDDP